MAVERKCPKCGVWNDSSDNCSNCNQLLNPTVIRKIEDTEQKKAFSTKPPDSIDLFLQKFKDSRFLLIRGIYYFLYSIWLVFGVAVSFVLYMVAGTVG